VRAAGLEAVRQSLRDIVPWLGDRVNHLQDWKQTTVLSVESSRLTQWYRPGLLLIGDAAHVMSPVMGVGINYAIQDAVETSNMLAEPLKQGKVEVADLAAVQKRRQFPVRVIQAFQRLIQNRIAAPALKPDEPFRLPWTFRLALRLPLLRNIPARMVAYGVRKVRVEG
jgi:2-polyprenyl-6-methoxyphenol hydroxylase-like FAD-dependent oxidoreductase